MLHHSFVTSQYVPVLLWIYLRIDLFIPLSTAVILLGLHHFYFKGTGVMPLDNEVEDHILGCAEP
jgi:hypothetical protein